MPGPQCGVDVPGCGNGRLGRVRRGPGVQQLVQPRQERDLQLGAGPGHRAHMRSMPLREVLAVLVVSDASPLPDRSLLAAGPLPSKAAEVRTGGSINAPAAITRGLQGRDRSEESIITMPLITHTS